MTYHATELRSSFQTDHTLVSTLDRQDPLTVRIIVLPDPGSVGAAGAKAHSGRSAVPSAVEDDILEATWEDAEWR